MLVVRAAGWWRSLARLGVNLPLFLVHDVGLLYAAPREQIEVRARPLAHAAILAVPKLGELTEAYRAFLGEIAQTHAASRASTMRLSDDLIVVVLARVLSSFALQGAVPAPWPCTLTLDPELARDLEPQLPALFAALPRTYEAAVLAALSRARLHVLTLSDAIDLDMLRLLGMLGSGPGAVGALAHVDLLAALSSPTANDIVSFSLELLPSILETHRAASSASHSAHGYEGVGRKGSIDSMVPTELAWDGEELARRLLDGDLLFYVREAAPDPARRLHYVVIDASASMRGEREVFARGLAIALAKKLELAGEEVWLRFFDSRLYDVHRVQGRGQLPAAWLLAFKGERGRNPARVFAQLATELALLRAHERREPVVHILTHAALHVPRPLVAEVRKLARLFGVFILPSGGTLDLEWLDLLHGHAVVDYEALQQRSVRATAAAAIVDRASRVAPADKGV